MCQNNYLVGFLNFFGDGSNFCEKFSFPKLILDKYLKLFFSKVFLNLNPYKV